MSEVPPSTPSAASAAIPPRPPEIASAFGPGHNHDVLLRLTPQCASAGQTIDVLLQGPSNAGVGMVAGYSDNDYHGSMTVGKTDARGSFQWLLVVPPDAPEGWATLLATTTGRNWSPDGSGGTEGAGTASARFLVAKPGGCP